jgi:hypothetical protein
LPKKVDWGLIRKTFVESHEDLTYTQIASMFNVSLAAVEARASSSKTSPKAEDWRGLREAYRIALTSHPISTPKTAHAAVEPEQVEVITRTFPPNQLDTRVILDTAIEKYYMELPNLQPRSLERATDSLCRLLELRNRLYPPTFKEWAKLTLEYGYNLKQMVAELKELVENS